MIIIPQMDTMLQVEPNPTESECGELLSYVIELEENLNTVKWTLNEVSTEPDEGLILIRGQIDMMISEARDLHYNLQILQNNAIAKRKELNFLEK